MGRDSQSSQHMCQHLFLTGKNSPSIMQSRNLNYGIPGGSINDKRHKLESEKKFIFLSFTQCTHHLNVGVQDN